MGNDKASFNKKSELESARDGAHKSTCHARFDFVFEVLIVSD